MLADPPAYRLTRELARFGGILAAVFVLHASALTLPHHWDALNRVHNAYTIAAHGFSPFLPVGVTFLDAQGRPPLLLQLLALTTRLAPHDLVAMHVLWLGFAALALYMTDRLGRSAWSAPAGAIAAVWLAASPLFFAQSEIMVMEVPVTAVTLAAAVGLVERRRGWYLGLATILVLAKEAAQLALPGFVLFAWWAAPPGKRWRDGAVAALPFVAFLAWVVVCKLRYGWFLDPYMSSFVRVEEGGAAWRGVLLSVIQLGTLLLQIGFWDGNWAPTLLVLSALVVTLGRSLTAPRVVIAAALTAVVYAAEPVGLALVADLLRSGGVITTGALLQDTIAHLQQLRPVLAVTAGLGALALPGIPRVNWRQPRLWLVIGVVAGYVGFFTLIKFRMVRYLLPTYPFVFLIAASRLWSLPTASWRRAGVAVSFVALFVSCYWGTRSGPGNIVESTLEFRDMIAVRRAAAAYLEGLAPASVLASWPETMELRYPFEGYVTKPLVVIEHPLMGGDVVYVSPQSRDPDLAATLRRAAPGVRLQPLLRIERGGKSVELYRVVR